MVLARVVGDLVPGLEGVLPDSVPIGVVSLQERIRPDAADMISFFADAGVTTIVLSGDDPRTVASVAATDRKSVV